jgi:hypothetical protein
MKVRFFWYISEAFKDGILRPAFSIVDPESDADRGLGHFADDFGGMSYINAIPWLTDVVKEIASIKNGEIKYADRCSHVWGVELSSQEAKIYSLYDDSYRLILTLGAFEKALSAWTEFLQATPDVNGSVELEIGR